MKPGRPDTPDDHPAGPGFKPGPGDTLAVPHANDVMVAMADSLYAHRSVYLEIVATRDWHIHPEPHSSRHPGYSDTWPSHRNPRRRVVPKLDAHRQIAGIRSPITLVRVAARSVITSAETGRR